MGRAIKRIFDIMLAVAGFLIFLPVNLIVAARIKLEDGGCLFFTQERIGQNRKPFRIVKFRTMNDRGEVTRAGAWARSRGLDEIPQIVNVIRGEMSIIGPRPLTAADIDRIGWNGSFYDPRFSVKPGITGLAQLYGGIGRKVSWTLDRAYARRMSVWLDVKIIVMSFCVNVFGKRRVREWLRR